MAFITSLRIKNFFSIKDEVNLSFKASSYNIEHNPNRLFEFNGEYYNKIISFYGANASGKTTILKAIVVLANIINNEQSDNFPISFKNKFAHLNSNSEIEIGIVIEIDNKLEELIYSLKFKSQKYNNIGIEDEILYLIENTKRQTFFNRKDKKIKDIDKTIQTAIFNNLSETKSLFQRFKDFDKSNVFEQIFELFVPIQLNSNISLYNTKFNADRGDEHNIASFLRDSTTREKLESFLLRFFNSIGLDVQKIEAKFKEEDGKAIEFLGLYIFHEFDTKEPLEFDLESDGTQMLMKILLDIFNVKIFNSVLVIDEFDSILHPMLIPIINNLLIENDIQIIYSTHNIYNMQFLQNDEIFLIEKDSEHKTTINPVKDNKEIKGYKNLLTLYENGYLGGLPDIKEILTKIV
jgi:AAA15 family ATPase/GTPase